MQPTRLVSGSFVRFIAGSADDPRPESNPFGRRIALCLGCNVIVHFSIVVRAWVDDGGHYHSKHTLEIPAAWLPETIAR